MTILTLVAFNAGCLVLLVLAACLSASTVFFVRRWYFHPLSKYPGPFWAKSTDLYAAYHAWKGDIHVDMWRCHEKYGPYVRYAPERLNINKCAALKEIYSGDKNFQKSPNYRVLRHQAANTLTMINKKEHMRRRRIISQSLSDTSVRLYQPTILSHIKQCFDSIVQNSELAPGSFGICNEEKIWTAPQNMSNWFDWLAFDIMGHVVFGTQYNLIGRALHRIIPRAIEESNIRISVLLQSPMIRRLGRVDHWLFPKAIEARNIFLKFIGGSVEQSLRLAESETTFVRNIVSSLKRQVNAETGDRLSAKEILSESITLCVAGADTTSTALAATFFYLASNARVYHRLEQEICSTFQHVDEIQVGPKLSGLTYLRACIDEALRMSPPAGSSLSRQVLRGGAIVDGQFFSEGVEIGVPIYGIHHNAEYYPFPFRYHPERWMEGEAGVSQASVQHARAAFCPFSLGTRSCVGKGMAMAELTLAVAYAMFTLEFKMDNDVTLEETSTTSKARRNWTFEGEFALSDHLTGSKQGPMLRFKRRSIQVCESEMYED